MNLDDELLGAYLDNELHEVVRLRVEDAAERDPELKAWLREQEGLRARLNAHFEPVLSEPVPESLTQMLAEANSAVISIAAAREQRAGRRLWIPAAMAASLALGLFGGQWLPGSGGGAPDPLIAQGEIARALDTQLASAQPSGEPVRVGVTFRNQDGQLCRTFDGSQAGFACREGSKWRLRLLAPGSGPQTQEFAQAGSGSATVLAAAQEAMAGEPFDPEAERQALQGGWR